MPPDPTERTRIMDAADRLLAKDPQHPLSVTEVLSAAGLSTRAFYRHFESKDALLVALFRRDSERLLAQLEASVRAAPNPRSALVSWIEGYLGVVANPRRRRRVLVFSSETVAAARGIAAERHRNHEMQVEALTRIIAAGRADGSFPRAVLPADARAIRAILTDALLEQISGAAKVTPKQAATEIADFVLRALGACPTPPSGGEVPRPPDTTPANTNRGT